MKQKATFLKVPIFVGFLFFMLSAAQVNDSSESWKELTEKASVKISYQLNNQNANSPQIELNFENANDYAVNVTWQNEVTFANDPNVALDQRQHQILLEANSAENGYVIELMEINTLQATLPVEDFTVLNLEISKN